MEQTTKKLPVQLTEEEVAERSQTLASTLIEVDDLEKQKADSGKLFATKIKERETRIRELTRAVVNHAEDRAVVISDRTDPRRFTVETIRHDTMAVIDTRAMNEEEIAEANQPSLFERSTSDSDDGGTPPPAAKEGKRSRKAKTEAPAIDETPIPHGDAIPCYGCSAVIAPTENAHRVKALQTGDVLNDPDTQKPLWHCDGCHASYIGGASDAGGKKIATEGEPPATDGTDITATPDLLAAAEAAASAEAKH